MRINRAWVAVLLVVAWSASALADTPFTSKQGRFSVVWPGTAPKATTQTVDSPLGKLTITMFMADLGSQAAMVGYNDYPKDVKMDPDKSLAGARDGAMKNLQGTVSSQSRYKLQGKPALTFRFSSKSGIYGQANLILAGNRLYQVEYYTKNKSDLDKPQAQNFLKSFKITQ